MSDLTERGLYLWTSTVDEMDHASRQKAARENRRISRSEYARKYLHFGFEVAQYLEREWDEWELPDNPVQIRRMAHAIAEDAVQAERERDM